MSASKTIRTPKQLTAISGERSFDAQALSMIVALTSELTIVRARLDTCERLLAKAGILNADAIDSFDPDAEAQAEREALRTKTMRKVFRSMIEASEADLASVDANAKP